MRAALTALLLVAASLGSGCLASEDDSPPLAQPTDGPYEIPGRNVTIRAPGEPPRTEDGRVFIDYEDAGYVITEGWSAGDSWYYETNASPLRFRHVEVTDKRIVGGVTTYVVVEKTGPVGQPWRAQTTTLVDGDSWTRLRATDQQGTRISFEPAAPDVRYFRNGSLGWNESAYNPNVGFGWHDRHLVNSYFAGIETVQLAWGVSHAGRVEHRDLITNQKGENTRALLVRWVDRAYLNDVAYSIDESTHYFLVGARLSGHVHGTLVSPPAPPPT